jgi:hypothetical protein
MTQKNPYAVGLGKLGGLSRALKTTKEQRRAWARLGGLARARKHSKSELTKWASLGGRPATIDEGKS